MTANSGPSEPDAAFDLLAKSLPLHQVDESLMFGCRNLLAGGHMFAVLYHGSLAVKLGRGTAGFNEAAALQGAAGWYPTAPTRPFLDWVLLPPTSMGSWTRLGELAFDRIRSTLCVSSPYVPATAFLVD